MLEKVEYIKSIFKIDLDNPYLITDIAEELVKIELFDDYRKWLKINLNHIDAQYKYGYQKFVFLTRMYLKKRLEFINAEMLLQSKAYAKELAYKVKEVSSLVEEKGLTFEYFKDTGGGAFFTDLEVSQLNKIGGLDSSIRLQKSLSGSDALADKLVLMAFDFLVTSIIEYKPQKKTTTEVSILVKNVVKRV
ncbi:MAG: hypothetical protein GQ531_04920 [Sulfurovum sp.]|nr:hypothetical protein [Sulfurovum sp.]